MYDYVDGKVDWMAFGHPVEGEDGPFLSDEVLDVATCQVTTTVAEVRNEIDGPDAEVLVLSDGLVVGAVDADALDGQADDVQLLEVMHPVPSTVRPSVTVASVAGSGGGELVVTDSDGRLLGVAVIEADEHAGHGHDDHEGHDHGEQSIDGDRYEEELGEVMKAMEERFSGRDPSAEEVHAFLRERLLAEGKTAEEADLFLQQLGQE